MGDSLRDWSTVSNPRTPGYMVDPHGNPHEIGPWKCPNQTVWEVINNTFSLYTKVDSRGESTGPCAGEGPTGGPPGSSHLMENVLTSPDSSHLMENVLTSPDPPLI